jgi:hypothetical protein
MKYKLLKKASKIHAVKCNKSSDFAQMSFSNNKLIEIMKIIDTMSESDVLSIENEIELWRSTKPIANENEINELLKKR